MFKKGQVWRTPKGSLIRIVTFLENDDLIYVEAIKGPVRGRHGWCKASTKAKVCQLTGNNYQEKAPAPLPDDGGEAVAVPRETHNLIQNLRRDNKDLRRQNKDLRDDIGDMASKLHLAYRDKFPGIAALWPTPEALPEQRGCRKEDC